MSNYTSSQKLWKVIKIKYDYYYEIKLAGVTVDRIRIEYPTLKFLKQEGVIK